MKLLGLNNKPLVAGGKAIILPTVGGDFYSEVHLVSTPSGEGIPNDTSSRTFMIVPKFKNGFIFLNWDVTKNNDLDITGNLVPEIVYVYIPSINVNKGMVTILDLIDTGNLIAVDNWINHILGSNALSWTDAFEQTDFASSYMVWGSKSGYSTFIIF